MDNVTIMEGSVPASGGVIGMEGASAPEKQRTSRASETYVENLRRSDLVFWGDQTNLFPQEVNADVEASDILETVITWKAQELTGGGQPIYGPVVPGPGGQSLIEPISLAEVDDFLEETNFPLYALEAALDYYRYWNASAELITSGGRVTGIWSQDQSWLRLATNDKTGAIRKAYQCSDWSLIQDVKDKRVRTWEALDPYFDVAGQITESKSGRMLLPLRYQTRGRKYYALAPWNGFRESKWFEIQKKVAIGKEAFLDHCAIIRYVLGIDDRYWTRVYKDWDKVDLAEQEKRKKDFRDGFEKFAAGAKNNGKTMLVPKMAFMNAEKALDLIEVRELKFEIPTGAYIEDSTEADFHAIRSMGVQPSLMGISQSKNQSSAGSGSVNRVDRTNYLLGERVHGELLMTPLRATCRVNEWNERNKKALKGRRLSFQFPNLYATTLDRTQQVDGQPNQNKDTADGTVQERS